MPATTRIFLINDILYLSAQVGQAEWFRSSLLVQLSYGGEPDGDCGPGAQRCRDR